jgi:hypothetical protein
MTRATTLEIGHGAWLLRLWSLLSAMCFREARTTRQMIKVIIFEAVMASQIPQFARESGKFIRV